MAVVKNADPLANPILIATAQAQIAIYENILDTPLEDVLVHNPVTDLGDEDE